MTVIRALSCSHSSCFRCVPGVHRKPLAALKPSLRVVSRRHGVPAAFTQGAVIEKEQGDTEGGTGVLDRPDFEQGIPSLGPSTESNFGATDIGGGKELGGGDYRLLLLDSQIHTEQLVVSTITTVVAGTDEQHAKNCFMTSKQLGQALVTSALKEHAEFYCEQMLRKGCKASIEPDTTTL
ncbi:hypothetical protein ABBQ32_011826 [Trebouxia sp. C0010 RCD-2024]